MSYKRDVRMRREKSMQKIAQDEKKKHDLVMRKKKTILVPHPTVPKTWIEKIIE